VSFSCIVFILLNNYFIHVKHLKDDPCERYTPYGIPIFEARYRVQVLYTQVKRFAVKLYQADYIIIFSYLEFLRIQIILLTLRDASFCNIDANVALPSPIYWILPQSCNLSSIFLCLYNVYLSFAICISVSRTPSLFHSHLQQPVLDLQLEQLIFLDENGSMVASSWRMILLACRS